MATNDLKKLLTINGDQLFMEGYNLNEFANMNKMSTSDFLDIFQLYILLNKMKFPGKVVIQKSESMTFLPSGKIQSANIGEVLVTENIYNQVKETIFDFAYTKCSNDMLNASWDSGFHVLTNKLDLYACTYLSPGNKINQMISEVPIDREEQTKKKALLKIR